MVAGADKTESDDLEPIARLIDILPDAVLVVNVSAYIVLANAAVTDLLGFAAASLHGQPLSLLVPAEMRAKHASLVANYTNTGRQRLAKSRPVLQAQHCSGALVPVSISLNNLDVNGTRYSVAVVRDARGIRDQLNAAIAEAQTDSLTGIGNRQRLSQCIAERINANSPFALLFFDLNGFKPFNDLYGHAFGDEVLKLVAKRALSMVRAQHLVMRVGGDEFVILLDGITDIRQLQTRAEALVLSLSQPFHVEKIIGAIGLSMGGALFPRDASSAVELLSIADANMYRAKKSGQIHLGNACDTT